MWPFRKRRQAAFERARAEPLEHRLLYSADLAAALPPTASAPLVAEVRTLDGGGEFAGAPQAQAAAAGATVMPASGRLAFEINAGQANADIDLLARGSNYTVGLSGGNATLVLGRGDDARAVQLRLLGANPQAQASPEELLAGRSHYLTGETAADWHTDIANYASVTYRDVYRAIDLRYHGADRQLEYDFIVGAGADAADIGLAFDGAQRVAIDTDGGLLITLDDASGRNLRFMAPVAYQDGPGGRQAVASAYALGADGSVHFTLGAYDHARTLVIDPVLAYGSYFGGTGADAATSVAVDAGGNAYLTGYTGNTGLVGTLLGLRGGEDVFVTKLSSDLSTALYTTYLGGTGNERANGIAVDGSGNAYVTGWTQSPGTLGVGAFPTAGAYQAAMGGTQDAFLFKLDAAGSALAYSTFLGGSGSGDVGNGVTVNSAGRAFVVGTTTSANFPFTSSAVDKACAGQDAFVAQFNPAGNNLVYATFLGGSGTETGNAIALDATGNAIVAGSTDSTDFAVSGAPQSANGGRSDVFVTRLNTAGSAITYSTYFGGSKDEEVNAIVVRGDGSIVIGGASYSNDLPVSSGALQASRGGAGNAGFVAILDPSAATLAYSTYLGGDGGGSANESVTGIGVDAANRIYAAGSTGSGSFPVTANALAGTYGGNIDGFVAVIDASATGAAALVYGSYLGGAGTDHVLGATYSAGRLYLTGDTTSSAGIATTGAATTTYAGAADAFAAVQVFGAAPAISSNGGGATAGVSISENSTAVTSVTASDPEGATPTFSIRGGADAGHFTINPTSGALAFAAAPDFEAPTDSNRDNVYDVIVAASDGALIDTQAIAVTVTNLNEAPLASGDSYSVTGNSTLTTGAASGVLANDTDPEGDILSVLSATTPAHGTLSLVPAALSAITNLTGNAATDTRADWSPDGTKIAFDSNRAGNNEIYVINADGSGLVRLTTNGADDSQAAWSPDGSRIAFMSNRSGNHEVWVMHAADGSGLTQLTSTAAAVSGQPAWSPDGSRIAFTSDRSGNLEIYVMSAAGGSATRLTTAAGDDSEPAWSPDGSRIAFASTRDGNSEIYLMNADGSGQTRLTSASGTDRTPTWSRDGAKIAFTSDRSGIAQVYMMDANGANQIAVTAQAGDVSFPDWSPDGRELLFTTAGEVQTAYSVFDGAFSYTPATGYVGTDSFSYTVTDRYGHSSTASVAISVTAAPNTAPVLGTSAGLALSAVNEDAPAPVGAVGTLVASLIDLSGAGGHDNVTDPDSGAVTGIAITASDTAMGTWWYSTNNGTSWNALGAVSAAGARLLAADAVTRVQFQPGANVNGSIGGALTFRAWDQTSGVAGSVASTLVNGGTSAFSVATATAGLTVNPVNDAPVGSSRTVTTNEDTDFVFGVADFALADPADAPANALASVKVTSLPGSGTLNLSGAAVVAGQFISAANIAAGNLRFTPAANATGNGYASFGFRVQDDGGTANGGIDLDSADRTIGIDVSPVNDAPVLAGANALTTILEDATGHAGTLVSRLIAGRITDVDAGAVGGIAVTAVNNSNGTWQYTIDGGGNWTAFGAPTAANARLLAADPDTSVRFVPNANWNGTLTGGISFRAWDRTSGSAGATAGTTSNGGTTAYSAATAAANLTVTAVNDAPRGISKTMSIGEDGAFTLRASDFGFSDGADSPANLFTAVRLGTFSGSGQLTLAGTAVGAGQVVGIADITAGNLRFTTAANTSGDGYASFTFQVQDDGGTANGGSNEDATPRTFTFSVTAVNDAPTVVVPVAQGTSSNTPLTFSAALGNAITVADVDAGLANARLTLSATNGTLTLGSTAGLSFTSGSGNADAAMTFTGSMASINGALDGLRFDPTPAFSGGAAVSIDINDLGNSGSGGARSASAPVVINVSFVNSAPVLSGANDLQPTQEDGSGAGTSVAALLAGHVSDIDAGALKGVAITAADNTRGTWEYSRDTGNTWAALGSPTAAAARLLAADAATFVRFVPNADWHGSITGGLGLRAWDLSAGAAGDTADTSVNGGSSAFSAATAAAGIVVESVNDAPAGTGRTITMLENATHAFTAAEFGFGDASDTPADNLLAVRIVNVPAAGALTLAGAAVTTGQSVSVADIDAGRLVFTPLANQSGTALASVGFQVQDDGGTAAGGIDLDPLARTLTIDVTEVSNAPVGADRTVTTHEDTAFVFGLADFALGDPDDAPANQLLNLRIATLPGAGSLALDGSPVMAGQFVSATDIAAGKLVFMPVAGASGAPHAAFTFQVQDDGGTANGGADLDPVARTLGVDVIAVNDAPRGADRTLTTSEDTPLVLALADFGFTDPADPAANTLMRVRVTTLPGAGTLTLAGAPVAAGEFVAAADIAAGRLRFTPPANAGGTACAAFSFQVQDDGGTANGGSDLDPVARTLTIDVVPVNDAPTGTDHTISLLEDASHTFTIADFGFADSADTPADAMAAVRITGLPGAGSLTLAGTGVSTGQFITAADIAAGRLVFTPAANGNGTSYAAFTFQLQDDGGTANGGSDLDPVARRMTLAVTPVNDAPVGSDGSVSTAAATEYTFAAGDFRFTDPADVPAHALASVTIETLPASGTLALAGTAVGAGRTVSVTDIAAGRLRFMPLSGAASFTFRIQDSGGTANGGSDSAVAARIMTVTIAQPAVTAPVQVVADGGAPPAMGTLGTGAASTPAGSQPSGPPAATTSSAAATPAGTARSGPGDAAADGAAGAGAAAIDIGVVAPRPSDLMLPVGNGREPDAQVQLVSLGSGIRHGEDLPAATALLEAAMPTFGSHTASPVLYEQFMTSMRAQGFVDELDRLREEARAEFNLESIFAVSAVGMSFGISLAYVLWMIRSGVLVGSLLSALPAWRVLDPLPVLSRPGADHDAAEDEDDDGAFADANRAGDPLRTLKES